LQAVAGVELEFGKFEDGKNGRMPWKVRGITDEAVKFFSTNHERKWSLKKELEESLGRAVPERVIQDAMRNTRRAKDVVAKRQDSAPVYELWQQDAERFGVKLADDTLIRRLRGQHQQVEIAPYEARRGEFFRRLYGEKGLTKDDASFTGKELAEGIARCAEGLSFSTDDRLHLELDVMDALIVQQTDDDPAKARYTTPAMLGLEERITQGLAAKAKTTGLAHPSRLNIGRAVANLGVELDAEQMTAVRAATAGRGLTIIQGWAGTGKTTSLRAVVGAGRLPGIDGAPAYDQVVVVSTASLAAQGTGDKVGADVACSIEALVHRVDRGTVKITDRTLVIVDEAAVTNTHAQDRLLTAVGRAQMIWVGDPEQAQPIGPGGTFQAAVVSHGACELTKVWRQRNPRDRQDFARLRHGDAVEMITNFDARFRFHVADTAAARIDSTLDFYDAYRQSGRGAKDVRIITDSSNALVDDANRHIQRRRCERGELGTEQIEVHATLDDRRWAIHASDIVMFLHPTKCGRIYVPNGTTGEVTKVRPQLNRVEVRLDDGRLVDVSLMPRAERQPLGLAYAVHVAKFQGSEVPVVLALPGGPGTTNKNSAYSTLTRCTEEAHVFADRETHGDDPQHTLGKAWAHTPAKTTATSRTSFDDLRSTEPAGGDAKDLHPTERRHRAYENRIARIAGPEVADRTVAAPAYPALQGRLDDLHGREVDEHNLLGQALRQRELNTAHDPAAVLLHRLDGLSAQDSADSAIDGAVMRRGDSDEAAIDKALADQKALQHRQEHQRQTDNDIGIERGGWEL
jgi:hypothetical protein